MLHFVSFAAFVSVVGTRPMWWCRSGDKAYRLYTGVDSDIFGSIIESDEDIAAFEASLKDSTTQVQAEEDAVANAIRYCSLSVARNNDGVPLAVPTPRTGSELIIVTHNFCDPTTWYETSERVSDQVLTDTGDGRTWASTHANWIDISSGKLFDEDAYASEIEHGYSIQVYVDGEAKVAREPYADSGGDYSVNFTIGQVTFFETQIGMVTATYSYATSSQFTIVPDTGKRIDVEGAEVQFSSDVILNDAIEFEVWVYNPQDLPNKVCIEKTSYKRMTNFIDEAQGCYPMIPKIGGVARGTQSDVFGFPFRYGTIRTLRFSQGVELRVRLKTDKYFGGEHATATFYCTTRSE